MDDGSNDNNNNSPTSPPRLVNIAIDSSLDINSNDNNNANGLSTPTKPLQGIKEESNNDNNEAESAVECINQLSFSSPTKITTLCNNTIDSTSSSTTNNIVIANYQLMTIIH